MLFTNIIFGTIFVVVAGWYRNKIAAAVIMAISFALHAAFLMQQLPQGTLMAVAAYTAIGIIIFGFVCYLLGWGLRWLWERRRKPN